MGPSTYQIISNSKKHLRPLQRFSYALGISLSIMELLQPDFFITF